MNLTSRLLRRLPVGAGLVALVVALLHRPIEDPDIWFHLVIGRHIAATRAIPDTEFYVFPLLGRPGAFHEWGFDLLFWLIERVAGEAGMIAANAAVGGATVGLLYLAGRYAAGGSRAAAVAGAAAAFVLLEFRFVIRPETLLYLAIAAELLLLERYRASGAWRWLLPLPVLAGLLAQCHPSPALLLMVAGAYAVHVLVVGPERRRRAVELTAAMAASVLVSGINPYGFEQLLLPFRFAADRQLIDDVTEFLPALRTTAAWRFLLGLGVAAASIAVLGRRTPLAHLLLVAGFGLLAWRHVRNIALLGLAIAPLAAAALATVPVARRRLAHAAAAMAVVGAALVATDTGRGDGQAPSSYVPRETAERIRALVPPGNVANFYHLGGYLAWRLGEGYRVLIDGRNFSSNAALALHDAIFRGDRGWEEQLARHGIDAVATPATLEYSGKLIPLVTVLARHPAWRLVSVEPAALLFVRTRRAVASGALPESTVWEKAVAELEYNLSRYPASEETHASLRAAREHLARARRIERR